MKWRELVPYLRELWQRPAGPMNWENPILVLAVVGWSVFQGVGLLGLTAARIFRFLAALPGPVIFFGSGLGYAAWHFVRRPFPALGETPLLDLMNYHTPTFYEWVMVWYYASPFVTVMLAGLFAMSIWKVWFESRAGGISPPPGGFQLGRFQRTKRLRESSLARSIIRSKRGRLSIPPGSPSRSADCIPAWRSSEPWGRGKPALA